MNTLTISLLGPFQAALDGNSLGQFRTNKAQALLVYLAAGSSPSPDTPTPHNREALMEMLWPDFPLNAAQDNLRQTLYQLRKLLNAAAGSRRAKIILSSHKSIQINPEVELRLDSADFCQAVERGELAAAAALYRGDFLCDFFLSNSAPFESWASAQRASLQQRMLDLLGQLAEDALNSRAYRQAIQYARRQLAIDNLQENAVRQLMLALARAGSRSDALAEYEQCCALLLEELALEPAEETVRLYHQIQDGTLPAVSVAAPPPPPAPAAEPVLFVARRQELARLHRALGKAAGGQGQVIFLSGSAGRGKTALFNQFAREAMARTPQLLVAAGSCSDYAGIGDPYLPFRDIMNTLAGGDGASTPSAAHEQLRRAGAALPQFLAALLHHGRQLLTIFAPGPVFLARVEASAAVDAPLKQALRQALQRDRLHPAGLAQSNLFQQMSNCLAALSQDHPLLIFLDDVQWIDTASAAMFFHLARRLPRSRIMLVAAYRPEEIPLGRGGTPHPMEKILAELKRQSGDIWIDLSQIDETEGRRFVDAIVAASPNRLPSQFNADLFRKTDGHPLFTVELLQEMRDRGDLALDPQGRWVARHGLDWDILPAKVEAAVSERINRLDDPLRELLTVAAVQGESFSAQVVAAVQGTDERGLLRTLSRQLQRQHRLVYSQGEIPAGGRLLSQYRFTHALFQQYLYQELSPSERRLIHHDVGRALESLYGDEPGEIAVQLARHFQGDVAREAKYARLAGLRAAGQYANQEAIVFLSRALDLTPPGDSDRWYELLLARERVCHLMGQRQHQRADLELLTRLAREMDDGSAESLARQAQISLRWGELHRHSSQVAAGLQANREAVALARQAGSPLLEASGHLQMAECSWRMGEFGDCRQQVQEALSLSRAAGSPQIEADALRVLGNIYFYQSDYTPALSYNSQALRLSREIGDRSGEASSHSNIGEAYRLQGEYEPAKQCYQQRLQICRQIGERYGESIALNNLGFIAHNQGDNHAALELGRQALVITEEIGNRSFHNYNLHTIGCALSGLGRLEEAAATFREAYRSRLQLGEDHLAMESLAALAMVQLNSGDPQAALASVEQVLAFLKERTLDGTEEPPRTYLICVNVLQAAADSRAGELLEVAHSLLQERAARIADQALRRSYLENVPANRQLAALWQARKEAG